MTGWISVHRQIQDHWVWDDKPFSRGQAWLDLILKANHESKKMIFKDKIIEIDRGQLARTERHLADDWGWSRTKLQRFLKTLKNDTMIEQKKDQGITIITICNYDNFQDTKNTKKPESYKKKTKPEPEESLNNNINNVNKINNDLPDYLNPEIWNSFLEHRIIIKKPMTDHAKKLLINKIIEFNKSGYDVNKMLQESIINGWQSIFEPRDKKFIIKQESNTPDYY